MNRREFIAALGGVLAAPLAWRAQQALPEIGILNSISLGPIADRVDAFLEGLEDTRFVIGKNVAAEYRSAEGQASRLPELAAGLVARNPRVIVCLTSASTVHAAMAARRTTSGGEPDSTILSATVPRSFCKSSSRCLPVATSIAGRAWSK